VRLARFSPLFAFTGAGPRRLQRWRKFAASDTDLGANSESHGNPDHCCDRYADSETDGIANAETDANTKADAIAHTKADAIAHTKADAITHTKADAVAHSKADAIAHTKADANPHTETDSVRVLFEYGSSRRTGVLDFRRRPKFRST
jgi:S-adenosylmethionine synthetase